MSCLECPNRQGPPQVHADHVFVQHRSSEPTHNDICWSLWDSNNQSKYHLFQLWPWYVRDRWVSNRIRAAKMLAQNNEGIVLHSPLKTNTNFAISAQISINTAENRDIKDKDVPFPAFQSCIYASELILCEGRFCKNRRLLQTFTVVILWLFVMFPAVIIHLCLVLTPGTPPGDSLTNS